MNDVILPPNPVYSLFSGGKDSFCCAHVLHAHGRLKGLIMLDTGIAADTWEEDTIKIAETHKFPYRVIPTTYRYEAFVSRYGFPGPGMHAQVMNYLKGRAIREFKKDFPGEALASGVRADESARRTFHTKFESLFEGVTVYAPLLTWTDAEVWDYVRGCGYEKPRTYLTLGISGDCLCGAYAMAHERDAIATYYPKAHERICRLERLRKESWGERARAQREHRPPELLCQDCKRHSD